MDILTREIIDLLWPEHDRTSCDDADLQNSYVPDAAGGQPRCNRCYALNNRDFKIQGFKIVAHIEQEPDLELLKESTLKKLTHLEKRALGLI